MMQTKSTSFTTRMLGHFWFRITALVFICAFELVLTWFLVSFGWLTATDWATQIAVVLLAASPLIIAAMFLAGRRFRLSSLLVAMAVEEIRSGQST